jgi:hypothetical protein
LSPRKVFNKDLIDNYGKRHRAYNRESIAATEKESSYMMSMVVHTCNPSTQEAEAGGS